MGDLKVRYMKRLLLFVLVFFYVSGYGQDDGYRRTLIHFENTDKYPAELMGLRQWLIDFTSKIPFVLKSHKTSPNEDAMFRLFSLRTNSAYSLEIGNSGNFLSFVAPVNAQEIQNVQYEGKWGIMAYNPSFNLGKFKPADNDKIFENSLFLYNVSEEQAMAKFLNKFVSDKNMPVVKQFVTDVEKHAKIKLDIKNYEEVSLRDLAIAIYGKTQQYSSAIGYQIYLKNKDYKKECANVNDFFESFNYNAIENFLQVATPGGKFYFEKPSVTLKLSDKAFLFPDGKNTGSGIELSFKYISYKFEYNTKQEPYLKLQFQNLESKDKEDSFELVNEEKLNKEKFRQFPFKGFTSFKKGDIKEVTIDLYKDKFRMLLRLKNSNGYDVYDAAYTVLEGGIKYK